MADKKNNKKKEKKAKLEKKDSKKNENVVKSKDVKEEAVEEKKIVYAKAKYVKGSAQKARLVIDLVRGKNARESVNRLAFVRKRAAKLVSKVIESAIANAVNNFDMDDENLKIVEAQVNEAPIFKRGRAGSRGRYKKILKRNSHIIIGLQES